MYLYIYYTRTYSRHNGVSTHQRQERREEGSEKMEEKKFEAQRAKPHTPTPAIDALIGDEEQTGKEKREKGCGTPIQLHWTSYDPHGSKTGPILLRIHAQGEA